MPEKTCTPVLNYCFLINLRKRERRFPRQLKMSIVIRSISADQELETSVNIIRSSFLTVAGEFNLTPENAPTNAAFIKLADLLKMRDRGIAMFGLFEGGVQTGFVAVERADENVFYLEKLAVLPEYRHRGFGRAMIDFACEHVKHAGGSTVSIGIIDDHTVLKHWYQACGFAVTGTKSFQHLPFKVCFLSRTV
ncbi:MAG: GNAT family N-acetyltransferase [Thermacetogeniaceae bacterium]